MMKLQMRLHGSHRGSQMAEVAQLGPHDRMSVDDLIGYLQQNKGDYGELIVAGLKTSKSEDDPEIFFTMLHCLHFLRPSGRRSLNFLTNGSLALRKYSDCQEWRQE